MLLFSVKTTKMHDTKCFYLFVFLIFVYNNKKNKKNKNKNLFSHLIKSIYPY